MCKKRCEHPEKLKGNKPGKCSEKQIRECHGEEAIHGGHPCKDCE